MSSPSPFALSTSNPGNGEIHLALFPPNTPILKTLSYQYPLKLIAPSPITIFGPDDNDNSTTTIHTVFVLTYGGGLVAGDTIDLRVRLDASRRLVLLTQGSTKIFKTPDPINLISKQRTRFFLDKGAALCYLPEPVQPFAFSCFEQVQIYELSSSSAAAAEGGGGEGGDPSLCVCDWVSAGRAARGENWDFFRYVSRNEVWVRQGQGQGQGNNDDTTLEEEPATASTEETTRSHLVLRDNVILDANAGHHQAAPSSFSGKPPPQLKLRDTMNNQGVFGTLILLGPLFTSLQTFFLNEFMAQPRVGARTWGDEVEGQSTDLEEWRKRRLRLDQRDGLLWTAARIRGCVVVKFSAREVEGGKRWLLGMLRFEGSVEERFGEKALLCLR